MISTYRYKAINSSGRITRGSLQASSLTNVQSEIKRRGFVPLEIKLQKQSKPSSFFSFYTNKKDKHRLTSEELLFFTTRLSNLLSTGVDVSKALSLMRKLGRRDIFKSLIAALLEDMRAGKSFSSALKAHKNTFPNFYIYMMQAGEVGDSLDVVMRDMVVFLQTKQETVRQIKSALIYPSILLVVAVISVIILVAFVLPQFTPIFESAGVQLPLLTRWLVGVSDFVRNYGLWIGILTIASFIAFRYQLRKPKIRFQYDRFLLNAPMIGGFVTKIELNYFMNALSVLLKSGVQLLTALQVATNSVSNLFLRKQIHDVRERVKSGYALSKALQQAHNVPKIFSELFLVGETTNQLDEMLEQSAQMILTELKTSIQRFLTILTPLITIGLAVVVSLIIGSILLALLEINELML